MNVKSVKMWYGAVALMCLSVLPFFYFMTKLTIGTLGLSLLCIGISTAFYIFATKKMTHPQDKYTAVQAMRFAAQCHKAGFRNSTICKERKEEFMELVSANDFMKDFDFQKALYVYQTGGQLQRDLKINKGAKG